MTTGKPVYDATIWKTDIVDCASIQDFLDHPLPTDHIVRIGADLAKVEFKANWTVNKQKTPLTHFLVCFSGAITKRAYVTAPLFSGISLSHDVGMPLLWCAPIGWSSLNVNAWSL